MSRISCSRSTEAALKAIDKDAEAYLNDLGVIDVMGPEADAQLVEAQLAMVTEAPALQAPAPPSPAPSPAASDPGPPLRVTTRAGSAHSVPKAAMERARQMMKDNSQIEPLVKATAVIMAQGVGLGLQCAHIFTQNRGRAYSRIFAHISGGAAHIAHIRSRRAHRSPGLSRP